MSFDTQGGVFFNGYDYLPYNCLYNFAVGPRGPGKTYWAKYWCVNDFLKSVKAGGERSRFIYLRRYKTELKPTRWFSQISHLFPGVKAKVKGNDIILNDEVAGYLVPLSKAVTFKSDDFHDVDKIIYDEVFLKKKSTYRYLPNEVTDFLDFYETVNRLRPPDKEVRVFFLANTFSMYNPYFLYFNITNPNHKEVVRKKDLLCVFLNPEKFKEMKRKTRFGQMIEGTEYASHNIDGEFYQDSNALVEPRSKSAVYYATFIVKGQYVGIWVDYLKGRFYVDEKFDKTYGIKYALSYEDMTFNTMLVSGLKNKLFHLKRFSQNFQLGNVRYTTQAVKALCSETFDTLF